MKLKELKTIIFDNVFLYTKMDFGDYKDLWIGNSQDIPENFFDYTVRKIGARRKGVLDIELRETEKKLRKIDEREERKKMNKKKRLFVDMDGTLTEFIPQESVKPLYEKGYFLNLPPHENVIEAIRYIINQRQEIEVNILSAFLADSPYALDEKNVWVDRYLPEINIEHRIFVPNGKDKKFFIPEFQKEDVLLDDYTPNLLKWFPARGIKLLNGINHTKGTWQHDRISYNREPVSLSNSIISIVKGFKHIYDEPTERK